jgi:hypothetical protein
MSSLFGLREEDAYGNNGARGFSSPSSVSSMSSLLRTSSLGSSSGVASNAVKLIGEKYRQVTDPNPQSFPCTVCVNRLMRDTMGVTLRA